MSILQKRPRLNFHTWLSVAILIAACTSKNAAVDADTGTERAAVAPEGNDPEERAPKGLIGPPGSDTAETRKYMGKIDFGKDVKTDSGFVTKVACPDCTKDSVELRVMAEKKSYKVDWPSAMVNRDNEGWIVAQITNMDASVTYPPLQLGPGENAYQWVGPVTLDGKQRAVAFYKIDSKTGIASQPLSQIKKVSYCNDPNWKKRKQGVAMPKHPGAVTCVDASYAPPGGSMELAGVPFFPPGSTWLSCAGGCCEVTDLTSKNNRGRSVYSPRGQRIRGERPRHQQ